MVAFTPLSNILFRRTYTMVRARMSYDGLGLKLTDWFTSVHNLNLNFKFDSNFDFEIDFDFDCGGLSMCPELLQVSSRMLRYGWYTHAL